MKRCVDAPLHYLNWLCEIFPNEESPQDRVSLDDVTPRAFERGNIQLPTECVGYLFHVHARSRIGQAVKEHSLLHWRERIEVFDFAHFSISSSCHENAQRSF